MIRRYITYLLRDPPKPPRYIKKKFGINQNTNQNQNNEQENKRNDSLQSFLLTTPKPDFPSSQDDDFSLKPASVDETEQMAPDLSESQERAVRYRQKLNPDDLFASSVIHHHAHPKDEIDLSPQEQYIISISQPTRPRTLDPSKRFVAHYSADLMNRLRASRAIFSQVSQLDHLMMEHNMRALNLSEEEISEIPPEDLPHKFNPYDLFDIEQNTQNPVFQDVLNRYETEQRKSKEAGIRLSNRALFGLATVHLPFLDWDEFDTHYASPVDSLSRHPFDSQLFDDFSVNEPDVDPVRLAYSLVTRNPIFEDLEHIDYIISRRENVVKEQEQEERARKIAELEASQNGETLGGDSDQHNRTFNIDPEIFESNKDYLQQSKKFDRDYHMLGVDLPLNLKLASSLPDNYRAAFFDYQSALYKAEASLTNPNLSVLDNIKTRYHEGLKAIKQMKAPTDVKTMKAINDDILAFDTARTRVTIERLENTTNPSRPLDSKDFLSPPLQDFQKDPATDDQFEWELSEWKDESLDKLDQNSDRDQRNKRNKRIRQDQRNRKLGPDGKYYTATRTFPRNDWDGKSENPTPSLTTKYNFTEAQKDHAKETLSALSSAQHELHELNTLYTPEWNIVFSNTENPDTIARAAKTHQRLLDAKEFVKDVKPIYSRDGHEHHMREIDTINNIMRDTLGGEDDPYWRRHQVIHTREQLRHQRIQELKEKINKIKLFVTAEHRHLAQLNRARSETLELSKNTDIAQDLLKKSSYRAFAEDPYSFSPADDVYRIFRFMIRRGDTFTFDPTPLATDPLPGSDFTFPMDVPTLLTSDNESEIRTQAIAENAMNFASAMDDHPDHFDDNSHGNTENESDTRTQDDNDSYNNLDYDYGYDQRRGTTAKFSQPIDDDMSAADSDFSSDSDYEPPQPEVEEVALSEFNFYWDVPVDILKAEDEKDGVVIPKDELFKFYRWLIQDGDLEDRDIPDWAISKPLPPTKPCPATDGIRGVYGLSMSNTRKVLNTFAQQVLFSEEAMKEHGYIAVMNQLDEETKQIPFDEPLAHHPSYKFEFLRTDDITGFPRSIPLLAHRLTEFVDEPFLKSVIFDFGRQMQTCSNSSIPEYEKINAMLHHTLMVRDSCQVLDDGIPEEIPLGAKTTSSPKAKSANPN